MDSPTFRERYCLHWSIPAQEFESHLLSRALYPHARIIRSALLLQRDYFSPDREFLRNVGHIRSRRYFHAEAGEFHSTSQNAMFLRRWLRLRVSAERTRCLMEECWEGAAVAKPAEVSAH